MTNQVSILSYEGIQVRVALTAIGIYNLYTDLFLQFFKTTILTLGGTRQWQLMEDTGYTYI